MNSTSDDLEWAARKLGALLARLAVQAAAELLDEAIERDDPAAIKSALRAYREALARQA
jgi:hypothetical protein